MCFWRRLLERKARGNRTAQAGPYGGGRSWARHRPECCMNLHKSIPTHNSDHVCSPKCCTVTAPEMSHWTERIRALHVQPPLSHSYQITRSSLQPRLKLRLTGSEKEVMPSSSLTEVRPCPLPCGPPAWAASKHCLRCPPTPGNLQLLSRGACPVCRELPGCVRAVGQGQEGPTGGGGDTEDKLCVFMNFKERILSTFSCFVIVT